jgi:hypothetical protein
VTTFVQDTFTGSAGNLTGHTGETGATWTMDSVIGSGTASDMVLSGSGELKRATGTTGNAAAYPSGTVTGDHSVEIVAQFINAGAHLGQIGLWDATGTEICEFGTNGNFLYLAGAGSSSFTFAFATTYTFVLDSIAGVLTLKKDGSTILTTSGSYTLPLSIGLYDNDGSSVARVTSFKIESAGAPPPASDFWTSFVGSHEVP